MYAYLIHLFIHAMIGRLYSVPACYLSNNFPVITFSKYENIRKTKTEHFGHLEILASMCKKEKRTHGHSTNMISSSAEEQRHFEE